MSTNLGGGFVTHPTREVPVPRSSLTIQGVNNTPAAARCTRGPLVCCLLEGSLHGGLWQAMAACLKAARAEGSGPPSCCFSPKITLLGGRPFGSSEEDGVENWQLGGVNFN